MRKTETQRHMRQVLAQKHKLRVQRSNYLSMIKADKKAPEKLNERT